MKDKLDENLGKSIYGLFMAAGHDTHTVAQESLTGAADQQIYAQCIAEQRCLVTLELDFSNPIRVDPTRCGIIIIRQPRGHSTANFADKVRNLLSAIRESDPQGKLWIVEETRIRIHQSMREE